MACALLSACVTHSTRPGIAYSSIAERQQSLADLKNWTARGRIALSNAEEGFSAAMVWRQAEADFDARLSAMLGQRALRVSQQGASAELVAPGRTVSTGRDAELLLLQDLGVRVPLTQFGHWMRGLPGQQGEAVYDEDGRLQTLSFVDADQLQWTARFQRYQVVAELELPELIDISGEDYKIRLLIKSWEWKDEADTSETPQVSTNQQSSGRLKIPGT